MNGIANCLFNCLYSDFKVFWRLADEMRIARKGGMGIGAISQLRDVLATVEYKDNNNSNKRSLI